MQARFEEIRRLGGGVLVVSFATPPQVAAYLRQTPLPFPVVSDPGREAYRAFGLERTSWRQLLRGGVLGRYLGLVLRGWLPRRAPPGEDVLQLGGDFVLDATGKVIYVHRSAEPTDRPPAAELVAAVASCRVGPRPAP